MPFDKPVKNKKIYDMDRKKNPPFQMDQAEIPKMKVVIHLSSANYIPTVKSSLKEVLQDMVFKEKGNEITVTAYPPRDNFGEDNVVAIVQKHDRHAARVNPAARR